VAYAFQNDVYISYNALADVVVDYSWETPFPPLLTELPQEPNPKPWAVIVMSNCKSTIRNSLLRTLQNYLRIDYYGKCSITNLYGWYDGDKITVQRDYQFVLAFENSVLTDYVSEKLYQAFLSNALPIYLGAPNVRQYLPKHRENGTLYNGKMFINVLDYPTVDELVIEINRVLHNQTAYWEYFQWRLDPNLYFDTRNALSREPSFLCDIN
jgi:hypothetical protein